jgi:hypothetical protein
VRRHGRLGVLLALGLIILLGFSLRLLEARRGLPYLHHWDEPFIANRALQIVRSGDFNPRFFSYGSLIIYAHTAVDSLHYLALAKLPDGDPAALREPAAIRFRGAREDPLVTAPEQEPYWISHPSFYLWNRRLTALFGTLAVALTFALTRRLASPPGGAPATRPAAAAGALAAAFVLATCGFHIEHSSWITTDVPATTLALAALLGTLAFVDGAGPRALLLAAAALGLAVSTKYNCAVYALAPAGALAVAAVRRTTGYRPWLWAAVPAVAGAAFLATTPYSLLDLPTFLHDTGRMLYFYLGNEDQLVPVVPGWPHLRLDLGLLAGHLGVGVALGVLFGLALALRRARAWVVLPFAPLVLWATSNTRTTFHRNLIVCYPLAAVAFGLAVAWAFDRWTGRRQRLALVALLLAAVLPPAAIAVGEAWQVGQSRDTRSQVVDRLNELGRSGLGSVAIARELNIHPLDLARLEVAHTVRPMRELLCAPGGEEAILLPTRPVASFATERAVAERLAGLQRSAGAVIGQLAPERAFTVDSPVADPGLELRRPPPRGALALGCVQGGVSFDELTLAGESGRNPQSLGLAPGASATTPAFAFPAGRALVALRGAAAGDEVAVTLVAREPGPDGEARELARWPLRFARSSAQRELSLPLGHPTPLAFALEVDAGSESGLLLYGLWIDAERPESAPGG